MLIAISEVIIDAMYCYYRLCLTSTYWDNFDELRTTFGTLITTVAPLLNSISWYCLSNSQKDQHLKSNFIGSAMTNGKLKDILEGAFET